MLLFLFSFWHPYDSDVVIFKVVLDVPKPLLIFLNSWVFIPFWLNVYFLLLFLIIDLGCSFLSLTVGSLYILLYFTLHSLHSFLYFASILNHFCEHPDHQFLNSASDRLAISSLLSCFFWSFDLFFHLGHISLSQHTCYIVRGGALSILQDGTTHFAALRHCICGRGLRGNNATYSALG